MKPTAKPGIGFFEKYLTLWVLVCMGAGVLSAISAGRARVSGAV